MPDTPRNELSERLEDCLEAILELEVEQGGDEGARVKALAAKLGVTASTISSGLKLLAERGLIEYKPYEAAKLTAKGREEARRVLRQHNVLKDFLVHFLGVDEPEADATACRMEHVISADVLERFVRFAEFAEMCPRTGPEWIRHALRRCDDSTGGKDSPWPDCRRCVEGILGDVHKQEAECALSALKPGEKGRIVSVRGEPALRRRLVDLGVTRGALVELLRTAPFGDPIEVKLRGYHLSLRKAEAAGVRVARLAP